MLAACIAFGALLRSLGTFCLFQSPDRVVRGSERCFIGFAQVSGSSLHEGMSLHFAGSVMPPPCSFDSPHSHSMSQSVFADHLSNACFPPSFIFVIWQGDPIPEDIYEILGGSSVRSISDLQRALRIDSVGKSPLHQTLLYFFLTLCDGGRGYSIFQQAHYQQTSL